MRIGESHVSNEADSGDRQAGLTDPPPAAEALTGHARIQAYLRTLDGSPGVYRMLDAESRVLYVGISGGNRSLRVESICPNLTKTGPRV